MHSFTQSLPALHFPGFTGLGTKTYAAWPVWSGSTGKDVQFQPMPKKAATKLWHRARQFDRQTKRKGHHGGGLGHSGLQVLHTLIFDFLNYASGRLDPSHAAIARKANVCERTVRTALKRLKESGIVHWVRRCAEAWKDGQFRLEQETNAYAVLPSSQWKGYREPPAQLPPEPGTWGDHPPLPSVLEQAIAEQRDGGSLRTAITILESDTGDLLAKALARLGRAVSSGNPQ